MFAVLTDHPHALDSPDHTHPLGCVNDNSRSAGFVRKAKGLFPDVRVLDLGCAGGGMVDDFVRAGGDAVGIEGSPLPRERGCGEWPRLYGRNLFNADVTKPFRVERSGRLWRANVVTAWEVLEHVVEPDLPAVLDNVRRHLHGLFVASVATFPDPPRHQTVRPKEWWLDRLKGLGFVNDEDAVAYFAPDWVRDQGERGFHVVCRVE